MRRIIDLALFTLTSPLLGHEEALRLISSRFVRDRSAGFLLAIAKHYEQSGVSYEAYFEFLMQRFIDMLEDWRRISGEVNLSILLTSAAVTMLEAVAMMLAGVGLIEPFTLAAPIALIPIAHLNQVKLWRYDYTKPLLAASLSAAVAYALVKNPIYILLAFSLGFSTLYIPQMSRFIRLMVNLDRRVLEPIAELLWSPYPRFITGSSPIEVEFSRLMYIAHSVGAPFFIARVVRVVEVVAHHIKSMARDGVLYGSLIPINFVALVEFINFINSQLPSTPTGTIPIITYHPSSAVILLSTVAVSLLTGKVIHSMGLGIVLMTPLLLALLIMH